MGTDASPEQGAQPSSTDSGWFGHSGFMDGLKRSVGTIGQKAGNLLRQGVEKGRQVAADPKTKQIAGQAVAAGSQIVQEQKQEGVAVFEAGRRGDVQGVIQHGLPLAGELAMRANPIGLAVTLAKPKVLGIVSNNVSPEHRDAINSAGTIFGGVSDITHLNIQGIGRTQILPRLVTRSAQQEGTGEGTGMPQVQPRTFTPIVRSQNKLVTGQPGGNSGTDSWSAMVRSEASKTGSDK